MGTTSPTPWSAVQPSSKVVQHAFVNARVNEINRGTSSLRNETIQAFMNDATLGSRLRGYSSSKKQAFCEDAFDRLTRVLQSRDLTINFKAYKRFTNENPYETYAQMYERGLRNGKMILDDSDPDNPAEIRVGADGRRPSGACTKYGRSYMVLKDKYKTNAIYFPEDTFYASGANLQVSYQVLGALFLKAKHFMHKIIDSCFDNVRLPDSSDGADLMEAHIFEPVRFNGGVETIILTGEPAIDANPPIPLTPPIIANAKTFCRKWGITFIVSGQFEFRGK
ncbi:MAG TPA: hypothetical protein VGR47_13930 [Terracidiphilus sp.]|nr:hypothetical protein [Terracidiphilus sp.]